MSANELSIAAVERETGFSKDVLRVWERRYGFPIPARDEAGDRRYPVEQVERLRLIRRLMDGGWRPGKLLPLDEPALRALLPVPGSQAAAPAGEEVASLIALICRHDAQAFLDAMQQRLGRVGLSSFVQNTVAVLTTEVGEAWERGEIEVFEEHLFTELTKRLLRQAISALPPGRQGPRILLTTVPEEPHVLGLLMVEAMCALEGAECIPLGVEMPLADIARAALAHQSDVVALSFARSFPSRQVPELLRRLRADLPPRCALWVGGGGVARVAPPPGVDRLDHLADLPLIIAGWREKAAS